MFGTRISFQHTCQDKAVKRCPLGCQPRTWRAAATSQRGQAFVLEELHCETAIA
jgi:hypothetical protein